MDDDDFKMVNEPVDSHVIEIPMFKSDGTTNGVARAWPKGGKFGWAHPDGREGIAENFELAVAAINAETVHPTVSR